MSITVALATRGRPWLASVTARQIAANAVLPDTRVVIGMDDDDFGCPEFQPPRVELSLAPREDSLGAKYNRCAAAAPADIYVIATDDCMITTSGWDAMIASVFARVLPDRMGAVYFGSMAAAGLESPLPAMQAVSREFVDRMGHLACPHFPFWFHDTWIDEIAHMIGRVVAIADIAVAYPDQAEANRTRGARDIAFWARLFDELRPQRIAVAEAIITDPRFAADASQRAALLARLPSTATALGDRNALIRDAAYAAQLEANVGFDAPDDPRYRRLKTKAEALLASLH